MLANLATGTGEPPVFLEHQGPFLNLSSVNRHLCLCYSNSWRRRLQSPMSQSGPFHPHLVRPSTAAWCRSSTMKTGSVEFYTHTHTTHTRCSICIPPLRPRLLKFGIWFYLITCVHYICKIHRWWKSGLLGIHMWVYITKTRLVHHRVSFTFTTSRAPWSMCLSLYLFLLFLENTGKIWITHVLCLKRLMSVCVCVCRPFFLLRTVIFIYLLCCNPQKLLSTRAVSATKYSSPTWASHSYCHARQDACLTEWATKGQHFSHDESHARTHARTHACTHIHT